MNNKNNSQINKNRVIAEAGTGFARYKGAFGDSLHQGVLPIFAMSNNNFVPLGTGFIITNSGIMMTARHVIENIIDNKEIRDSGEPIENFGLFALYSSDKKNTKTRISSDCYIGGPIRIIGITTSKSIDIALCQLQLMKKIDTGEQLQYPIVRLNLSIPKVGMKILGVGYCKNKVSSDEYIKKGYKKIRYLNYSHEFITTGGEIVEVIESQGNRRWPHFRTTAKFESGMSGGPVFIENGSVCGVICSSLSNCTDESGYISYVSDLGPTLSFKVDILLEGKTEPQKFTLFELIKLNIINADDSKNSIEIIVNEAGKAFLKRPISN